MIGLSLFQTRSGCLYLLSCCLLVFFTHSLDHELQCRFCLSQLCCGLNPLELIVRIVNLNENYLLLNL